MKDDLYNPYIFGPPVQDPRHFFGREHELMILKETISHFAPGLRQSMAVVGPRRIGKTSLLHQLVRQLASSPNPIAFMTTEQIVPRSPLLLTQSILEDLRASIQAKYPDTVSIHLGLLDNPPPPDELVFQKFLRDMQKLNDRLAEQNQPAAVLVIDEVEGLLEFGGLPVLGFFRHLAQSLSYLLFVVAGSDRLYSLINDTTSPFFNVFKTITISPLPESPARAMVVEPAQDANLCFRPSAVNKILELSGGEPYLINMLCHYAVENVLHNSNVTDIEKKHVISASDHILAHEHGYFLYTWQQAQGLEKVILYTLAAAKKSLAVEDILKSVESTIGTIDSNVYVDEYVRELSDRQILRQDQTGHYYFGNLLLPFWLCKHKTKSQVLEESSVPQKVMTASPDAEDVNINELRRVLTLYSENELKDLMLDLGVDYANFRGSTKSEKVRGFLVHLVRHSRLQDLLASIDQRQRSQELTEMYIDFDIRISPDGRIAAYSPEGEVTAAILTAVPNDIRLSLSLIETRNATAGLIKELGSRLYDWLFPGPIHTHFTQTEAVARAQGANLRLRLRIEADEIASLPLEFIYHQTGGYFVAINPSTVLSRYLNLPLPQMRVRRREGPLHMLAIIADPVDHTRISPDEWETVIQTALVRPLKSGQMTLVTVKRATRKGVRDALLEQKPDIIQFVGHSIYQDGKGYLALADDGTDKTWLVDDERFVNLFLGHDDNLGLICLTTCESARSDDPQGFLGIAPRLVQRGVPAVVAMQYKAYTTTSRTFLEDFYVAVSAHKPVDWAIQAARNAIAIEFGLDNREFATPVLYMRAKDGVVF